MRTIGAGRSSLHARQRSCSHPSIVQPIVAGECYSGRLSAYLAVHSLDDLLISRAISSLSHVEAAGRVSSSVVLQTRSFSIS
jgi:hypothetical protein